MKNPYPQWFSQAELTRAIEQYKYSEKTGDGRHSRPVVKLVMSDEDGIHCIWLISEVDPYGLDEAYGLVDQGLGSPEPSFLSLKRLSRLCNSQGISVVRDNGFFANGDISTYAAAARLNGSIDEINL